MPALLAGRKIVVGAPPRLRPPGAKPQGRPPANSKAAAEPAVGSPFVQAIERGGPLVTRFAGRLTLPKAVLAIGEYSPAFAKRNDVPQEPLSDTPASWSTSQVSATLGLLVLPLKVPVYTSWRHENSRSTFLKNGIALASPKTGTFICVKTAQTLYGSASVEGDMVKLGPPVLSARVK